MKRTMGLILLVAGIAVAAYGGYEYYSAQQSLKNKITKVFTGTTKVEQQSVYLMIGGGAAALLGLGLTLTGRTSRRR